MAKTLNFVAPTVLVLSFTRIQASGKGGCVATDDVSRKVRKNLGVLLANEVVIQPSLSKVEEQLKCKGSQLRGDDVGCKGNDDSKSVDMVGRGSEGFEAGEGVQLVEWLSMDKIGSARGVKVDLRAVGMDIDKGVSKIIGSDAVVGSVEPAKTQVGPKAGKWKMWARDGVKTDGGMDGDSSLGKCKVDKGDLNMGRKKKKMAIVEGDSCVDTNELLASRVLPACRSQ
ncbi:hypothetical protein QYF36_005262 [Acer negundo]|nr:hypothetical protein QYF36_005262 [Acer negundo]